MQEYGGWAIYIEQNSTHHAESRTGLCASAEINNGPLSVLQTAVKNHSQILIALRNGRKLLARCKAFDRHCNLVLENVKEVGFSLSLFP